MAFSLPFLTKPDVVSLPQNDKNSEERRKEIEQNREVYQWTHEAIADASMIAGLPSAENPELGWVEGLIKVMLRVSANGIAIRVDQFQEDGAALRRQLFSRISSFATGVISKLLSGAFDRQAAKDTAKELEEIVSVHVEGTGNSLNEYKEMFKVFKPDIVATLDQFLRDDVFGWYRVAGPNPMRLTKLDKPVKEMFPELTDDILRGIRAFGGDSIEEMQKEGRLFYVDYPEFSGLKAGVLPDGTKKEGYYIYSPTALFAAPKNLNDRTTVLPIAIRCDQDRSYPMYTPNLNHTDEITWIAAKQTVQVADGVIHEAVYHLGRTHLLIEVFNGAANRTLAPNHPIMKLLENHFYGTCLINTAAVDLLINPGGTIDKITAPQIEITKQVAASSVNSPSFSFNNWMPDKELASRGVLDAKNIRYPYRDYAIRLWGVVNEWVDAYLSDYYKNDKDVLNDTELEAWCEEIIGADKGNLHGFGDGDSGRIKTKAYLIRVVSMIIFTASVQHAAVNFTQSTLMQFTPAMPLAGFHPPPKTAKPFANLDEWVTNMLPDLDKAKLQMDTAELIGVFQYTTLGEYGRDLNFLSDEVESALKNFQEQLSIVGADIQKDNVVERIAGLPPYTQLVPKNIPQSINV
ncbi:Lipoxygenase [Gracilaria domingensis]|nr:Lipoxygenase [Gracilaria domingensis]